LKIFSWLIALGSLLSAECRPKHHGSTPKGTPQILAGIGEGYENGSQHRKLAIYLNDLR